MSAATCCNWSGGHGSLHLQDGIRGVVAGSLSELHLDSGSRKGSANSRRRTENSSRCALNCTINSSRSKVSVQWYGSTSRAPRGKVNNPIRPDVHPRSAR